eukprot:scaffold2986_cov249-Pinguiococcus_pyrenoidosus.AAC.12
MEALPVVQLGSAVSLGPRTIVASDVNDRLGSFVACDGATAQWWSAKTAADVCQIREEDVSRPKRTLLNIFGDSKFGVWILVYSCRSGGEVSVIDGMWRHHHVLRLSKSDADDEGRVTAAAFCGVRRRLVLGRRSGNAFIYRFHAIVEGDHGQVKNFATHKLQKLATHLQDAKQQVQKRQVRKAATLRTICWAASIHDGGLDFLFISTDEIVSVFRIDGNGSKSDQLWQAGIAPVLRIAATNGEHFVAMQAMGRFLLIESTRGGIGKIRLLQLQLRGKSSRETRQDEAADGECGYVHSGNACNISEALPPSSAHAKGLKGRVCCVEIFSHTCSARCLGSGLFRLSEQSTYDFLYAVEEGLLLRSWLVTTHDHVRLVPFFAYKMPSQGDMTQSPSAQGGTGRERGPGAKLLVLACSRQEDCHPVLLLTCGTACYCAKLFLPQGPDVLRSAVARGAFKSFHTCPQEGAAGGGNGRVACDAITLERDDFATFTAFAKGASRVLVTSSPRYTTHVTGQEPGRVRTLAVNIRRGLHIQRKVKVLSIQFSRYEAR